MNSCNNKPTASASHSACRQTGPTSERRPAPLSWDTVGGIAIISPMQINIASDQMALPTATAARVIGPCRPANSVSTTLIAMDAS